MVRTGGSPATRGAAAQGVLAVADPLPGGGDVPAVHGESPDDEDIQGDDEQAPDRVVRQPHEVQHDADRRDRDSDEPRPQGSLENEESRDRKEGTDEQVNPAPGGEVELEDPFLSDDVEVVVEQGDRTLNDLH